MHGRVCETEVGLNARINGGVNVSVRELTSRTSAQQCITDQPYYAGDQKAQNSPFFDHVFNGD